MSTLHSNTHECPAARLIVTVFGKMFNVNFYTTVSSAVLEQTRDSICCCVTVRQEA